MKKYFNGEVVCTDSGLLPDVFKVGNMYYIKRGRLTVRCGTLVFSADRIESVKHLNEISGARFIEAWRMCDTKYE